MVYKQKSLNSFTSMKSQNGFTSIMVSRQQKKGQSNKLKLLNLKTKKINSKYMLVSHLTICFNIREKSKNSEKIISK